MTTSTMTAAERICAALHGEAHDRVPFSPFLAYVWEYFPEAVRNRGQLAFHHEIGADPLWRGAPCPVKNAWDGVEWRRSETADTIRSEIVTPVGTLVQIWSRSTNGGTNFLTEHPVKTVEDLRILRWAEEHCQPVIDLAAVEKHRVENGREGLSLGMLIPRGKSAFQSLIEHHVGTEELAYLLCDHPDEVEATWQVMAGNDRRAAALAASTGAYNHWITWEDSSTQNYSPDQYRRYIGPEIAAWCATLARHDQHYIQHACGHVRDLVPEMMAGGVLAVESMSPPPTGNLPLADCRRLAGDRFGIVGGIEPVHFLKIPAAEFPAYVRQVLADGAGGPFVLANSDSCPPGVTVERFAIAAALARETGPVATCRR